MAPINSWKLPHIIKGTATWVPLLRAMRRCRSRTGGTNAARYCYTVWLRHLVTLSHYGFQVKDTRVGELGPGDSIGNGLAALLSGVRSYVSLNVVPSSSRQNLEAIFNELVTLYSNREPIPDDREFPRVRPKLASYCFPEHLVDWSEFDKRVGQIKAELRSRVRSGDVVNYIAPWRAVGEVRSASLDLIFSQSVLEYVSPLGGAFSAMATWLKPGGYGSHAIDFSAMYLSPYWNGHWAYSGWQWRLVRGRRDYFLNREPLGAHLACAEKAGMEILAVDKGLCDSGLGVGELSADFRRLGVEDRRTRGALVLFRRK